MCAPYMVALKLWSYMASSLVSGRSKVIPEEWHKGTIIPLYEGEGPRSDCSNYRGKVQKLISKKRNFGRSINYILLTWRNFREFVGYFGKLKCISRYVFCPHIQRLRCTWVLGIVRWVIDCARCYKSLLVISWCVFQSVRTVGLQSVVLRWESVITCRCSNGRHEWWRLGDCRQWWLCSSVGNSRVQLEQVTESVAEDDWRRVTATQSPGTHHAVQMLLLCDVIFHSYQEILKGAKAFFIIKCTLILIEVQITLLIVKWVSSEAVIVH